MKIAHTYHAIEQRRPKAILVRLDVNDPNAVWLPLHRIEIDESAGTVACTDKLWQEKNADRQRDWRAEKDAQRKAQRDAASEMLPLGGAILTESGKAIFVAGVIDEEVTDIEKSRRFYFPLSQCQEIEGVWHTPAWLLNAKAAEVVYDFVSNRGSKGIDHLAGTYWQAHFAEMSIAVTMPMLHKAAARAR
jgi:hypothetical protein